MDVGTLLVRHDAASAAAVRRQVAADLTTRSLTADSVDDVLLVISELVGNAITHAADSGELDVVWQLEGDTVTVRVSDDSTDLPQLKHVDASATNGRGLAIVAAIAQDWGVHRRRGGKQVWARVPVHHLA